MHQSKYEPRSVFFLGMTDTSYYSPDCGKTIEAFKHDVTITNFEVSANGPYLLGYSLVLCEKERECPNLWHLYVSEDKGKSWRLILPWVS